MKSTIKTRMKTNLDIFEYLQKRTIDTPNPEYFESMAQKILAEQNTPLKRVPYLKRIVLWSSAAAAAILLFLLIPHNAPSEKINLALELNALSKADVLSYVHEHLEEFDTDMLVDAVPSENIETISLITETESPEYSVISQAPVNFDVLDTKDILEYLENEGLDIYDLDEI